MRAHPTIAVAGPDDAAVVHRLTQVAFGGYTWLDPPSGAVTETVDVVRAHLEAHPGLLAFVDGVAAGALRLVEQEERLHARRVAVDPAYQGRGVARALMAHAEDAARAAGRTELRVGVRSQLPDNRALYEHLGYTMVTDHGFWVELRKEL